MTSQYRHRRTSSPSTVFPNPLEPGEIAVNTANRQIAVGDAQTGVIGAPLPLLVIRYFDTRAIYAFNDMVVIGGNIQRALVANGPGGFNQTQWTPIAGVLDPRYVAKAGDTMTGPLVLPGDPANPLEATDKHYVDTALANKSSVIVSDTPPVGVIDNTLWFESDTGFTYLMFNDGTSRQWVLQAGPPPDTSQFVQRTGDTMSGKLIAPALQAATLATASYSTPLSIDASVLNLQSLSGGIVTAPTMPAGNNTSAVANTTFVQNALKTAPLKKNYIINGAMMVSQENGSTAVTSTSLLPLDQFIVHWVNAGYVFSYAQVASVTPAGSPNRLRITTTAGPGAVGAGEYLIAQTRLEGLRIADLMSGSAAAKTITLQFGCKAPAGTYAVELQNSAQNRSYTAAFTISAGEANTDVLRSVTIALDTIGTWNKDNSVGVYVNWTLYSGATFQTAPGVWTAGNFLGVPGSTDSMRFNGSIFELFDVSLTEGTVAPPFVVPDYASELAACQRYWERLFASLATYNTAGAGCFIHMPYKVVKRAVPTGTFINSGSGTNVGAATVLDVTTDSLALQVVAPATGGVVLHTAQVTANARL